MPAPRLRDDERKFREAVAANPHDDPAEIAEMLGVNRHRAANLIKRLPNKKTSQGQLPVCVPPAPPEVPCEFDEVDTELADEPLLKGDAGDGDIQRPQWEDLDD